MKNMVNVIRWVGVAIFEIMAVYALFEKSFLSSLLLLLGGAIIAPIGIIKTTRNKLKLNKELSIVLAVMLLVAGVLAMPDSAIKPDTSSSNTSTSFSEDVYVTATGSKYHSTASCSGLSRAKAIYDVTLEEAENRGLGPCSKCY